MKIKNLFKLFKRKPKMTGEEYTAKEIMDEIKRDEFTLIFKMAKQDFKKMLPLIQQTKQFPIIFGDKELQKMTREFMIEEKKSIELNYGDLK